MTKPSSLRLGSLILFLTAGVFTSGEAAQVGSSGYTNAFSALPPAADWSTFSITGAAADLGNAATLESALQAVAAASINGPVINDPADPPAILGSAVWSSTGQYLQTRATGNGATLLMCTLVNNLGADASAATIGYSFAKVALVAEEVEGHRAYYSTNGASGSWIPIPAFASANPGTLTATLNVTWRSGTTLYLLWADDNGSGSPDTGLQIDNFSISATPATQIPVSITAQPQSRTVTELFPVSFTVGTVGNPAPSFQWYRNDVLIPGATAATYTIPAAPLSDHTAHFKVVAANVASNVSYSVTSDDAILSVTADTGRPVLLTAIPSGLNQIVAVFSERLAPASVINVANYSVTGSSGNLTIQSAALDASQTNLLINVSAMTLGTTYTLTVNNVTDQSVAANIIAADSQKQFLAVSYTFADVGAPAIAGSSSGAGNGFDMTSGGTNIAGASDQFSFNYRLLATDFDVKVRVASLALSDTWAKAGLMARENLNANSRYAASIATPSVSGSFFQSRSVAGAVATSSGSFPVNYPYTWLRLKRTGDVFSGYGSLDGDNWMQLGSVTLAGAARPVYVGMALLSANGSQSTTAQFRDVQDVVGGTIGNVILPVEPPGPSSRRTGLVITEIMYKAPTNSEGHILDFVEIYNSNPYWEDISGYKITGDIDYVFPPGTILQGGEFRVIAKKPADIQTVYGIGNVMGPYGSNLTTRGTVRLRNKESAIFLEVPYSNESPWPVAADGTGHSLVLARPSYGEMNAEAWGISDAVGGSPGRMDGVGAGPLRSVVINEFLANTDLPLVDYIELYNHANQEVDISGCTLSDDPRTNKFVIPTTTKIPARGFVVFYQNQFPFGLSSGGETLYFRSAGDNRVLDAVQFGAQANGISSGRQPDGASAFHPLVTLTPGTNNSRILIHDVVINEIMYRPISGDNDDEYVELYNKGTTAVNLSGWRFVSGIDYTFPSNAVLGADRYIVVGKNVTNLLARYSGLNATNAFGDYDGSLGNRGERLALGRPDFTVSTNGQGQVSTNLVFVVVDEVNYNIGGNWGSWANEGGSSLELTDPRSDNRLAHNWADSDETAKAPWTTVSATGAMEQGVGTANLIELLSLGEGEYLVDNVEVLNSSQANMVAAGNTTLDAGIGNWFGRGTHIRSQWTSNQGVGGTGCLHVRASARGDTMGNRAVCAITTPSGVVTLRAQVRWLRGWPEFLLRLHGNHMEAFGRLQIPTNLGTPGARNSRAISNAGPAVYEVTHTPVLPAANEDAVVTARVDDSDGIASLVLNYRVDPGTDYAPVTMVDNGTGGDAIANDGIFSGSIPGQPANTLVAFQITATDSQGAARLFPLQLAGYALPFECLVRFGDPILSSSFGTYRQWFTQNTVNTWDNRPALSNERMFGTFIYGNFRVIYNIATKYSSSPYHQDQHNPGPVTSSCHYVIEMPMDDQCLGTENWNKVHAPGNSAFDENTNQREQIGYWFARQMGLPWNYRRYVHMIVNGVKKGSGAQIMEDTERAGSDFVDSHFPNDSDGNLYKMQPWFEVDDGTANTLGFANQNWCTLNRYRPATNASVYFPPRYRQNWLVRAVGDTANDFAPVYNLIDAANTPTNGWAAHAGAMENIANMEEWMRVFAVCHSVGDWDHFGTQNSQNMYSYKPVNGKWTLMIWDFNILLGNSGSWGPGQNMFIVNAADTRMPWLYANPKFRRMYLRGIKEMAGRHMQADQVEPVIDARQAAFLAGGVNVPAANVTTLKTWIRDARNSILTTVATEDAASFSVNGSDTISTNNNLITLTGLAPVEMVTLTINGVDYPITWINARTWSVLVAVEAANNVLNLQGRDLNGNVLPGFTATINVEYTGAVAAPESSLVINEIMYNPTMPEASFVEIFNKANFSFLVDGWRVHGIDFTFPPGTVITNGQYVVLAKNLGAFAAAYGGNIAPFGQFDGGLDDGGETLKLQRPTFTFTTNDTTITTNTVYVTVNGVKYDDDLPWPAGADGAGAALQLIDPEQDNSRVSNWSDHEEWRYVTYTGLLQGSATLSSQDTNFSIFMSTLGDVYIDDIKVVLGTVPEAGANLLQNGDFEAPLAGTWSAVGNHGTSALSTAIKHSGNSSLHVVATGAGNPNTGGGAVRQVIPGFLTSMQATISFWFIPTTNGTLVTLRTRPSSSFNSTNLTAPLVTTPGVHNSVAAPKTPYDPLWINELQPNNLTGITDNNGERDPWIEIYNSGTTTIDLSGYYLANSYEPNNLTQWQFPAGSALAAGAFKIVWADGQPQQSTATAWHANFRLNSVTGSVALVRLDLGQPQITDYMNYTGVGSDLSYGDFPNGQSFDRQTFFTVTPGAPNSAKDVNVFINEWMADNLSTFADPADGQFEDWFELYNPGNTPVDLGGYWLTDNLSDPTGYQIPNNGRYIIPAGGFLLVWADGETNQNSDTRIDLHADFSLRAAGEAIGLFAPNAVTEIDRVSFNQQTNNISEGRFADGAAPRYFMTTPTPRGPNTIGLGNTVPSINPITDRTVTLGQSLSFTVTGSDPDFPAQSLNFTLEPGFPAGAGITPAGLFTWTPVPAQAPGTNVITVRLTDNGVPALSATRSFTVTVRTPPQATIARDGSGQVSLAFGTITGRSYQIEYRDSLTTGAWLPLLASPMVATSSTLTVPDNLGAGSQRFYRIVQVD
jgi:hypothetical protein